MKLWKRFTNWLHYLRHPCTVITMDEAPAKGVNVTISYSGEYQTEVDDLDTKNLPAIKRMDEREKEHEQEDQEDES